VRVARWPQALPQYRPGHLERAAAWKAGTAAAAPGVFLAGASYFGLGIPACVVDARRAADEVTASLATRDGATSPGR
jgi:oxygen-dependent protoporphyrinogen oxidase